MKEKIHNEEELIENKDKEWARNELMEMYAPIINNIANNCNSWIVDKEDVKQEWFMVFDYLLSKYSKERWMSLISYVYKYLPHHLSLFITNYSNSFWMSDNSMKLINSYNNAKEKIFEYWKTVNSLNIAMEMWVSLSVVLYIENMLAKHDGLCVSSMESTMETENPSSVYNKVFENEQIHKILDCLDKRSKDIILKKYWIGCNNMTLEQIWKEYWITKEAVRQNIEKSMSKLKNLCKWIFNEEG